MLHRLYEQHALQRALEQLGLVSVPTVQRVSKHVQVNGLESVEAKVRPERTRLCARPSVDAVATGGFELDRVRTALPIKIFWNLIRTSDKCQ